MCCPSLPPHFPVVSLPHALKYLIGDISGGPGSRDELLEAENVVSRPQCHLGWLTEEPALSSQFSFHCLPPAAPRHLHPHQDVHLPAACSRASLGGQEAAHTHFPPLMSSAGMGFSSLPVPLKRKEPAGVRPPQETLAGTCLVKLCLVLLPPRTGLGRKRNLPPTFYLPEVIYSLLGGGCCGLYDQQPTLWFGIL